MNKILLTVAFLVTQLFAVQTVVLLGDKSYPPYSYMEDGVAKGVYVDIIKAANAKIPQYDVKFRMVSWNRAIALIKKGKASGFFPPYYFDERREWAKFSKPILAEKTYTFSLEKILKDRNKFPEDFFGLTVCLNTGFNLMVGGQKMKSAIENNDLKIIYGKNNNACLGRVFRGVADVYVNDEMIDRSKFPTIKKGPVVVENFGHIGFTLQTEFYPYIDDFEKKFNLVIQKMQESGEINYILNKFLKNKGE